MLTIQASLGNDTTNWDFSLPVKEALHQADLLGPIEKLTCSEPALASAAPSPMQSFVKGATEKAGARPGVSPYVASSFLSPSRDGDNPFGTTLPSPEMREFGRLLRKQKHPHVKSLPWKN